MDRTVVEIRTSILGYLAGTLEFCREEMQPIDPELARKIDLLHEEVIEAMAIMRSRSQPQR
ncbi:hypothetical protein SAMN05428979_0680 [Stappia sp. ES.058]|nr:hypothetical protein SAMN05428979_0680 [Stappia sp. ES.058]